MHGQIQCISKEENQIMFNELSKAWQSAFSAGWESFKNGSVPIGAAICDENGKVICTGRNRVNEITKGNSKIAHAETDCLLKLDTQKYPDLSSYTLYACMEPCPMCMGTIVMSNFRKLRIAAKDGYCGSAHYCDDDRYIRSKNINVIFELGDMQLVQLAMQTYFELKKNSGAANSVIECFAADRPDAVDIAGEMYNGLILDKYAENNADFGEVFDMILSYSV